MAKEIQLANPPDESNAKSHAADAALGLEISFRNVHEVIGVQTLSYF